MKLQNTYASSWIGVDQLFKQLDAVTKTHSSYPPHNVIKHSDEEYTIEIAAAGFGRDDLSVSVKENVLSVSGQLAENDERGSAEYIHRGIGRRAFTREFSLGEHLEVRDATYSDGILTVHLVMNVPKEKQRRHISIA